MVTHILIHKREATRAYTTLDKSFEISKLDPSDIFSPVRPNFLIQPQQPPTGDQELKHKSESGPLSFSPPYPFSKHS